MKKRILVLCTWNSARSQMAEGLLRARAGNRVEVHSAGTKPMGLNPLAVAALSEINVDISRHESKDVSVYAGQEFDLVITVCDNAREACPVFPGARMLHWSLPDPHDLDSFRSIRNQLSDRIDQLFASW